MQIYACLQPKIPADPQLRLFQRKLLFYHALYPGKKCIFGSVNALGPIGQIVNQYIQQIESHYQTVKMDKYVVMPNHIHMILCLNGGNETNVSQVIGQFKSGVTREVRKLYPDMKVWQRSFHDHVIRSQAIMSVFGFTSRKIRSGGMRTVSIWNNDTQF